MKPGKAHKSILNGGVIEKALFCLISTGFIWAATAYLAQWLLFDQPTSPLGKATLYLFIGVYAAVLYGLTLVRNIIADSLKDSIKRYL